MILLACCVLGGVYEVVIGYSYALSASMADWVRAPVDHSGIPGSLWYSFWAVLGFVPVAAIAAMILVRIRPRPLIAGVVAFILPVLAWRLFWLQYWVQFDYGAAYLAGSFTEFFSVLFVPLLFVLTGSRRRPDTVANGQGRNFR